MNEVIISIGSNIDPKVNIENAKLKVAEIAFLKKVSTFYETKPKKYLEQDNFLNGAFLVETNDNIGIFRQKLKEIEIILKRIKTENKAGPRTIDLDIIVWNEKVVDEVFYHWEFVYQTVLEVKPDLKFDRQLLKLS